MRRNRVENDTLVSRDLTRQRRRVDAHLVRRNPYGQPADQGCEHLLQRGVEADSSDERNAAGASRSERPNQEM